jgi:hypothetical protein
VGGLSINKNINPFSKGENMINLLKRIGGAPKDAVVHMFGLQALFGSGTGETKKAAIIPDSEVGFVAGQDNFF